MKAWRPPGAGGRFPRGVRPGSLGTWERSEPGHGQGDKAAGRVHTILGSALPPLLIRAGNFSILVVGSQAMEVNRTIPRDALGGPARVFLASHAGEMSFQTQYGSP